MKNLDSETIDFSSIFKGYRIHIPFFLLCIVMKKYREKQNVTF